MIRIVGKGSFGVVRQVRCNKDKKIYAVKTIPLQAKKAILLTNDKSLNEVEIMKNL
jgi:serine/threonine protein kinase